MKKFIYLFIFFSLIFTSCTEKLDIELTGDQELTKYISTEEGLEYLKNGAYSIARSVYANYFIHFAEMIADTGEIYFYGTYQQFRDLQNKSMVSTFTWAETSWEDAYSAINNCNLVIDSISIIEDEETRLHVEADAKFIRGLLYFDLTRFFALPYGTGAMERLAIPLVLNGVTTPEEITSPDKDSVNTIFSQVESDLQFAYNNLPSDEKFYASKYSAAAILSRLYLTLEQYDLAAAYADSVITSGYFNLSGSILSAFNHVRNTEEDVFAWQQTIFDNVGEFNEGLAPFYSSTNEGGRSEMVINYDFLYSVYDITDQRGFIQFGVNNLNKINQLYYEGFGTDAYGGDIFCAKWLSFKLNINMVRLAEMYLTRAEANQMIIENGGSPDPSMPSPTDDIKVVRGRAGVDTTGNAPVTLEDIRLERYKELIFEGHRLHDYKRWQHTIWGISYDDNALIVPIPKKEIDANPNLQ